MESEKQWMTHQLEGGTKGMRALVDAVDRFAESCGWSAGDAMAVQVSLDEMLSNTLKYGGNFADKPNGLTVALASDVQMIRVVMEDEGDPFDPLSDPRGAQARTRAGIEIGGRGLIMVQTLMDDIQYARHGNTNRLTMIRVRRDDRTKTKRKQPK